MLCVRLQLNGQLYFCCCNMCAWCAICDGSIVWANSFFKIIICARCLNPAAGTEQPAAAAKQCGK